MQYFRAHFLQVHRRNNENRRVLYTHFTSVVVRPCSLKNALSLVDFILMHRILKPLNVSLGMVSFISFFVRWIICSWLNTSARFYLQRLSPIGGTSMICAILFIVPCTVAVPLVRASSTAFVLGFLCLL